MDFVVNEWLPEYLRPTASAEKREKAVTFLKIFIMKPKDRIVVREPSEFLRKIHRFRKEFDYDNESRMLYKNFIKAILENSEKCLQIPDSDSLPLPIELQEKISKGNFSSDTYLFEAALHSDSKAIVTTDERLQKHLADTVGFQVILLDDFLAGYV
ncbi:MAG: hypothetical protein H7246_00290 [Phycisphaerae bacterium]|nr:hypothetical protein [Saprospiraceae bacterium]